MEVVVLNSREQAVPWINSWEQLAANSLETNPFYEPWMLLPALQYLNDGNVKIALVVERLGGENAVHGVFPLEQSRGYRGIPLIVYRMWRHPHSGLTVPLVATESATLVISTFIDWLREQRKRQAAVLELPLIARDGAFYELLPIVSELTGRSSVIRESYDRAVYSAVDDVEQYLRAALVRKRRKELARLRRRLSEQGQLTFSQMNAGDDVQPWIESFMRLERSGWKGDAGTALACSDSERSYFQEVATEAFRRSRLMITSLALNDVLVAMKCNFLSSPVSYAFKIAFNEQFAGYSPGVLLEIDTMKAFSRISPNGVLDSCAEARHPMIERIWTERRRMESHMFSLGGMSAQALVKWILPAKRYLSRNNNAKPRHAELEKEGEVMYADHV